MICKKVEHGVARPIRKSETGTILLIIKDTGTRTANAPTIPCIITNLVLPIPLKNPIKQNKNAVNRQSMAYAFR